MTFKNVIDVNNHPAKHATGRASPTDLIAEACARLPRNLTPDEWRQYLGDERYAPTCQNLPSEEKSQAPAEKGDRMPRG